MRVKRGFALDHSCVLYLPFYRYGGEQTKIWDASIQNLGPNLISNGTMETGNPPTGWSTLDSPEVFERSAVQKHSGSYSAHINDSTPSYGAFFQNLGVVLGKKYKVSFWYYLVSGTVQCFGLGDGYNYTTTGSWQYVEFFVISNGGSYNLLKFNNASNTVAAEFYIDDVMVQETFGGGVNHGTITGAVPAQTPLVSPVELVSNGGMETGNPPTGWDAYGTPEVFESSGVQKHSGAASAHVNDSTPSYGGFDRTINTTTNKCHKLSFWYYKSSGSVQVSVWDGVSTWLLIPTSLPTPTAWTYAEFLIQTTSTGTARFIFQNNSDTVAANFYIDDVSVREVQGYQSLGWSFDGVDDQVNCGGGASLNVQSSFTVGVWVRPMKPAGLNAIMLARFGSGAVPYLVLRDNDPTPNFQFNVRGDGGGESRCASTTPSNQDIWKCVVGVRDTTADKLRIFINGVREGEVDDVSIGNMPSDNSIYIGASSASDGFGTYVVGESLLFNRALSAQEIKNYYESTRGRYGV